MALHMTKIAYGAESIDTLRAWLEAQAHSPSGEARPTTRYLPKRHAEMIGGSLYWIHAHSIVGRSTILGFEQQADGGRWAIRLAPELIAVQPRPKRAHQGWRYLEEPPADLGDGEASDALPGYLASELAKLGL